MTRFKNDPRIISVKFACNCSKCKRPLKIKESAYYWPSPRTVDCLDCGHEDFRSFVLAAEDEDYFSK